MHTFRKACTAKRNEGLNNVCVGKILQMQRNTGIVKNVLDSHFI